MIVSAFTPINLASFSTVAPVIDRAATEFAMTSDAVVETTASAFILAHGGQRLPAVNLLPEIDAIPSSLRTIDFGSAVWGNRTLTRSLPNNQRLADAGFVRPFPSFTEGESVSHGIGRQA